MSSDKPCLASSRLALLCLVLAPLASCTQSRSPTALADNAVATGDDAGAALETKDAASLSEVSPRDAAPGKAAAAPDGMLLVPGGTFTMGADRGGQEDEHPAHLVTLAPFFLDKTEVTNGAYAACVQAKVCRAPDPKSAHANHFGPDEAFRGPKQPVSSISWDEARAYCGWVGKRLPREAEWERAARGDDGRTYPWGNEPPSRDRAVYGAGCTEDVGSHPEGAGPYGHLDMAGNVWEWLEDIYDPYAYRRSGAARGEPGTCDQVQAAQDELRRSGRQGYTGSNPIPTECEHDLRGGAFNYDAPGLRSSNRVHHPGHFRLVMSGVRCAKDAE